MGDFNFTDILQYAGAPWKIGAGVADIWRGSKEGKAAKPLYGMAPEEYAKKTGMPEYQMSEGVLSALGLLQTQTRADLPGADIARQDYSRGMAMAMYGAGQTAESSVGAMGAQGAALDKYNQNIQHLNAMASQYRSNQMDKLASFYQGPYAQEEMNKYQYNQMLPYSTKMNEYWARKQGADQMIGSGLDALGSAFATTGSQAAGQQTMQGWYPQSDTGSMGGGGGGANPAWGKNMMWDPATSQYKWS